MMGGLKVAIIDSDKGYMESLAGYISSNYGLSLSPCCFTNLESFTESSIRAADTYDIVLIAPELYEKNALAGLSKSVVFLEKEALYPTRGCRRYLTGIAIQLSENSLKYTAYREPGLFLCGGRLTPIIAVYSPIGGSESTIAAGSASNAQEGHKVLYLNLERASCTSAFLTRS